MNIGALGMLPSLFARDVSNHVYEASETTQG